MLHRRTEDFSRAEVRRPILGRIGGFVRSADERVVAGRSAMIAFGLRVTAAALLYLSQILLARWMGPAEYGIYVFAWTCVLVLGGLAPLGISSGLPRLIPVYRETGEYELLRGLLHGGRLLAVGMAAAVALLGYAVLKIAGPGLDGSYVAPLMFALICIPLYTLTDVQDGIGRSYNWVGEAVFPSFVLRPIVMLSTMALLHAVGASMTAAEGTAAAIVAAIAAAALQTALIEYRLSALPYMRGPRRYAFREWLTTTLPFFVIGGAELLLQNADVLIVSRYMTPAEVGIYFAAAKTMALITFVHYAVASTAAQRFATLHARGDHAELAGFVSDSVNWTFWPSLAGAALILALGYPLLSLFGADFTAGYPVMFVVVVGYLVRSAMGPVEAILGMVGEQRLCAAVMVGTTLLSITLSLILVPIFGLMGAAASTALSLTVAAFVNAHFAKARLGLEVAIWHNLPRRRAA